MLDFLIIFTYDELMNNTLLSISDTFISVFNQLTADFITFIPTFLVALVVFLVGLLVARIARNLIIKLFSALKLSKLTASPSLTKFLKKAEIEKKLENVFGEIVRWLIILVFSITSLNLLGLDTLTQVLNGFLNYIPNIFASLVIILAGTLLAGFLERVVKASLAGFDVRTSRIMGKFTSYLIMIVIVLAAISQLGIAQYFINILFIGFIAIITLAFGLGLGLGSKDLIKKILEDWYKNLKKQIK